MNAAVDAFMHARSYMAGEEEGGAGRDNCVAGGTYICTPDSVNVMPQIVNLLSTASI